MRFLILLILSFSSLCYSQIERKLLYIDNYHIYNEYELCEFKDVNDCNRLYFVLIKGDEFKKFTNAKEKFLIYDEIYFLKLKKLEMKEVPHLDIHGHISIIVGYTRIWADGKTLVDLYNLITISKEN